MFLWYVKDKWRQGQTAVLTQLLLLTIAALFPQHFFRLGLLNRGSLRATALSLQAGSHSGLPVSNWLNCGRYLPIFFHNAHLLPLLLPLIYTGASLIDGSVKGQYTTNSLLINLLIYFEKYLTNVYLDVSIGWWIEPNIFFRCFLLFLWWLNVCTVLHFFALLKMVSLREWVHNLFLIVIVVLLADRRTVVRRCFYVE